MTMIHSQATKKRKLSSTFGHEHSVTTANTCNPKQRLPHKKNIASNEDPIQKFDFSFILDRNQMKGDHISRDLRKGLRVLQDKQRKLGYYNIEVASVLNSLGMTLFQQKDFKNALIFFQEELRIKEALIEHRDALSLSTACNNIGRVLQEAQQHDEASKFYQRCIQLLQSIETDCDKEKKAKQTSTMVLRLSSTVWYNLGLIYDKMQLKCKAIKAFQMSLHFRKVLMGTNHADVACLLFNIGVLQIEQEMLKEATYSITEFLRIYNSVAIPKLNDHKIIMILQKLASLLRSNGSLRTSLQFLREILIIQRNSTEMEPADKRLSMGVTLRGIAELCNENGQILMAITKAQESVALLKASPANYQAENSVSDYFCEELISSLMLLGSLMHENNQSMVARSIFYEAINVIDSASSSNYDSSFSFEHLREISFMLAISNSAAAA